jgi:hypothetical protein
MLLRGAGIHLHHVLAFGADAGRPTGDPAASRACAIVAVRGNGGGGDREVAAEGAADDA